MDDTIKHPTPPSWRQHFGKLEPVARKSALGIIIATAPILIGQYLGASSVASAMQKQHMDAWAAKDTEHAAAMAKYLDCFYNSKSVLTKSGCVEISASGQLAAELDAVAKTPNAAWKALPAPLRWFLS